ncbi:flotillin domain-containing protein [Candidatus Synchoanobacter obligatus]|uniref:Flotillin family protein n=1 Tax=Candidatus Synchoanobacter obligatus TaxID=2919597 RepID=A0ABT1L3N4_9GAMM|nr:flotillin family protein [Candidatus Synchoanobacter obligatus]
MSDATLVTGVLLLTILSIGFILSRLYHKAQKELSFVRTGMGGEKVVINGGILVLPIFHDVIHVNMNTIRLPVHRSNNQALITQDRMRVDVVAEFYVRVQPTKESIANAAQTLGILTTEPEQLKDLVEGKFVDALRSVASAMSMEELHEKRVDFVQKVQNALTEDLLKNGLELETVSLTGLDQTSMQYFNPNNAFDAEGLTRLTEEIQSRKKKRNDIEQDTEVQIKTKNLAANKQKLAIDRDQEYAQFELEREIEVRRAEQQALIIKEQAENERLSKQASIEKDQKIKQAEIEAQREVEQCSIESSKQLEITSQEKNIAVSKKSQEQSIAKAEADKAYALAVAEEEKIQTTREQEIAQREKSVQLIEAEKNAEQEAIAIKIAAEAEKASAINKGHAIKEIAEAEAHAEKTRAEASQIRYAVEATGQTALNEAANLLNDQQVSMKVKLSLIENLESMIRESVKPMENIDGIKIVQVSGLNGATGTSDSKSTDSGLADQMVNSALKYRAQAPLLDALMSEVGLKGGDINGLISSVQENTEDGA